MNNICEHLSETVPSLRFYPAYKLTVHLLFFSGCWQKTLECWLRDWGHYYRKAPTRTSCWFVLSLNLESLGGDKGPMIDVKINMHRDWRVYYFQRNHKPVLCPRKDVTSYFKVAYCKYNWKIICLGRERSGPYILGICSKNIQGHSGPLADCLS